ncbi:MAG: hypothetical protein EON61_18430 [Alphaproteobacteria bacterium]|jgi:hypothetical protein|nr:MAG: hypothetical protein EON61_18430 [Alphaproteobacteria bacterium]
MRGLMVAGALAVAACGLGGVAQAQPPADDLSGEEYCVYMKLTDTLDYAVVAEALLAGLDQDKAQALVKTAGEACIKEYGLSQAQASLASDVGIFGSAADYLMDELMDDGLTDATLDGIYDVVDEMSDEDLDLIFDGGWRDDVAMKGRMKAALIAKGFPDKSPTLDDACLLIEVSVLGLDAVAAYVMGDFDEDQS